MRLKNTFLILLKLVVIVGLIVYLPSKVSSPSKAQVINAIDNSNQVTASYQNMESKVVKDKKIHIYNTHQGEEYDGYNVVLGANYLKDCLSSQGYQCDVESNDFDIRLFIILPIINHIVFQKCIWNKAFKVMEDMI